MSGKHHKKYTCKVFLLDGSIIELYYNEEDYLLIIDYLFDVNANPSSKFIYFYKNDSTPEDPEYFIDHNQIKYIEISNKQWKKKPNSSKTPKPQ